MNIATAKKTLKIENIVASGAISGPIDLVKFSENVEHCELKNKTPRRTVGIRKRRRTPATNNREKPTSAMSEAVP